MLKKWTLILDFDSTIVRVESLDIFADIDTFLSPSISIYPHFYLNKAFVFTLHDMQERYFPEFFNMKEKVVRWLSRRILARCADIIICESTFVKKDIINFIGVHESRISVIKSPPPENFLNFEDTFSSVCR